MAVSLDVPNRAAEGKALVIAGAGWGTDPVTLTINRGALASVVLTPDTGAITTDGVVEWAPLESGTYTIAASDGTDSISKQMHVYKLSG